MSEIECDDGRKNNPNMGRPKFKYTDKLGKKICEAIVTSAKSLKEICDENPDFPKHTTLYEWIATNKHFSDLYLEAKRKQIMIHMEETYALADTANSPDSHYADEKGNLRLDPAWVSFTNRRIELRKWHAARLQPRLFGDKSEVTTSSIEDKELKNTVMQIRDSINLLKKHERDY
jgi:hypothetical protein